MTAKFDNLLGISIEIRNPVRGNVATARLNQVKGRTQGGVEYVYDRGVFEESWQYQWEELTYAEKEKLRAFHIAVAVGMQNFFQLELTNWMPSVVFEPPLYPAPAGGKFIYTNVRFDQPFLDFEERADGRFAVAVTLKRVT